MNRIAYLRPSVREFHEYLHVYLPKLEEYRDYAGEPDSEVLAPFHCAWMLLQTVLVTWHEPERIT